MIMSLHEEHFRPKTVKSDSVTQLLNCHDKLVHNGSKQNALNCH